MSFGRYQFLPWARRGIAKHIKEQDTLGNANGTADERAQLELRVKLSTGDTEDQTLSLLGPGDVVGISTRSLVRTEPRDGITNFGPNLLAYAEFYDEDFAFRYTPASAADNDTHLRPWLMLVVLKEDEFVMSDRRSPLPSFVLVDENVLPPADELHLWAHVHSNLPHEESDLDAFIDGLESDILTDPDGIYSRVICPRRLDTKTLYHAFLIPTYETGRRAGLGQPTTGIKAQTPSWPGQTLEFPVYHRWSFRTGQNFDFEHLVKQLEPRVMNDRVGVRDMDCSRPAFVRVDGAGEVRAPQPSVQLLGGAVMAPTASIPDFPSGTQAQPFLTDLEPLVNLNRFHVENPDEDPFVSVPFYGMHHAERRDNSRPGGRIPPSFEAGEDNWYNELNKTPGHRVPAGFGKRVVQENQERFVDMAWNQLGDIVEANRRARFARLAELAIGKVYEKTLGTKRNEEYLAGVKPLLSRVRMGNVTVLKNVSDSIVANASIDSAFRRAARVNGMVSKRLDRRPNTATFEYGKMLKTSNKKNGISALLPDAFTVIPKLKNVTSYTSPNSANQIKVWSVESNLSEKYILNRPEFVGGLPEITNWGARFSTNVIDATVRGPRLGRTTATRGGRVSSTPAVNLPNVTTSERISLPGATVVSTAGGQTITLVNSSAANNPTSAAKHNANVRNAYAEANQRISYKQSSDKPKLLNDRSARIAIEEVAQPKNAYRTLFERLANLPEDVFRPKPDPLLPAMAYPDIHDPMYKHLVEVDSEFLLPNLQLIPNNTLSLLKTNQKFIESYMVGLNYEMGRELMWREYPTDRRGSYFRQFWDVKGLVTPNSTAADAEAMKDIKPIHTWLHSSKLGQHNAREPNGDSEQLVFVIRGDLLKKFPNTVIYAQKAIDDPESDDSDEYIIRHRDMTDTQFEKEIRWPLYQAEIKPDIKLLGFDLTISEAVGEETTEGINGLGGFNDKRGWYFVLAEVPGEPQFGMDISYQPNDTNEITWNDLSWQNIPDGVSFIRKNVAPNFSPHNTPTSGGSWGKDSAHMAGILMQRPVMVAIHAREMLESNVDPELDFLPTTTIFKVIDGLQLSRRRRS